jgi:hypothetical protein
VTIVYLLESPRIGWRRVSDVLGLSASRGASSTPGERTDNLPVRLCPPQSHTSPGGPPATEGLLLYTSNQSVNARSHKHVDSALRDWLMVLMNCCIVLCVCSSKSLRIYYCVERRNFYFTAVYYLGLFIYSITWRFARSMNAPHGVSVSIPYRQSMLFALLFPHPTPSFLLSLIQLVSLFSSVTTTI